MALIGTLSGSIGASNALTSRNAITGSLVIANVKVNFPTAKADSILFVSGSIGGSSKSVIGGDLFCSGTTIVGNVSERILNNNGSTGVVSFDVKQQGIFYINKPAGDITANFINVPVEGLRIITPTIILSQSSTARNITEVRIENVFQQIKWAGGVSPTVTANRQEVFGFSLIRSGSKWAVLGQMTSYG